MNHSLERELLRLQLKSDAELARLIRETELQSHLYLLSGATALLVILWVIFL